MSEALFDFVLDGVAAEMRSRFGLSPNGPFKAEAALARLGEAYPELAFRVVPDEELRSQAAEADRSDPQNPKVRIRQSAMNQLCADSAWARELVFHEISHIERRHEGVRFRTVGRDHSSIAAMNEIEADGLMRRFLVPYEDRLADSSVDEIMSEFNISRKNAEIRLEEIKWRHRRIYGGKRVLPSGVVDFLVERQRRPRPY